MQFDYSLKIVCIFQKHIKNARFATISFRKERDKEKYVIWKFMRCETKFSR